MLESIGLNLCANMSWVYTWVYIPKYIHKYSSGLCLSLYSWVYTQKLIGFTSESIRKYWLGLFLSLKQKNWSVYPWVYTPTLPALMLQFISDNLSILCMCLYPNISRVHIFVVRPSYHYAVSSVDIFEFSASKIAYTGWSQK